MTHIRIIKSDKDKVVLSKVEQANILDKVQQKINIPKYHFDNLLYLLTEVENVYKLEKTGFTILDLKQLLSWASPILHEIPFIVTKSKSSPVQIIKPTSKYYLTLQTENVINGYLPNVKKPKDKGIDTYEEYSIPPYYQFKMIGLRIDFLNNYGKYVNMARNRSTTLTPPVSVQELIRIGHYNLHSPDRVNYINQWTNIDMIKYLSHPKETYIIFKDETHAKSIINSLFIMINNIRYQFENMYLSTIMEINKIVPLTERPFDILQKHGLNMSTKPLSVPFLKELNQIYNGKILTTFSSSFFADLSTGKLLHIYYMALALGINHASVVLAMEKKKEELDQNKLILHNNFAKHTIELKKTFLSATAMRKFNKTWNKLTSNEQQLILLLFNKFITNQESPNIDCVHIFAINEMRDILAIDYKLDSGFQVKRIYKKITSLFDMRTYKFPSKKVQTQTQTQTQLISCIACKTLMVCPHFITLMKLIIEKKHDEYIRNFMLSTYATITTGVNEFYCAICSEKIIASIDTSVFQWKIKPFIPLEVDNPLQNIIMSEVVSAIRYLSSSILLNKKNIINNIIATITPEIEIIESKLNKSRTSNKENISRLLRLYAYIYSVAILVNLVNDNKTQLKLEVIVKGARKIPSLGSIMKQGLGLILQTKKSLINLITNITSNSIKPMLNEAWRWAIGKSSISFKSQNEQYLLEFTLALDPFYAYVYRVANYAPTNPISDTNFKFLLGNDLKTIKKNSTYIYKDIYVPNKPWDTSDKGIYNYNSYKLIAKYISERIFGTTYGIKLEEFYKESKDIKATEQLLYNQVKFNQYKPYITLPTVVRWLYARNVYLSEIYCPSGERHVFDIMIYKTSSKRCSFTSDYVATEIIPNPSKLRSFHKYQLIDRKCSICGMTESTITSAHEKKIEQNINKLLLIEGFYIMYDTMCPEGDLHLFKNNACTKCRVTSEQLLTKSKGYFEKYKKQYISYLSKKKPKPVNINIKTQDDIVLSRMSSYKKFPKWSKSFVQIVAWAKLLNISYNSLINLGLSEDADYTLIEKGKINPYINLSEPDATVRHIKLDNYLSGIFREYQLLKNHKRVKLPLMLQKILDKTTVTGLSESMSNIVLNYYERYEYYKYTESPSSIANFVLHTIASTLINIFESFKKSSFKKFGSELSFYFTSKLTKADLLLSKLDYDKQKQYSVDVERVDNETYKDRVEVEDAESLGVDVDDVFDPFSASANLDIADVDIADDSQGLLDQMN